MTQCFSVESIIYRVNKEEKMESSYNNNSGSKMFLNVVGSLAMKK